MLTSISMAGIKSFKQVTIIPLAPLTILTGTNSSGKSSVFQTLLALKQTFQTPPIQFGGISLNGKCVSLGSYEDWSSDHKMGPMTIGISLANMRYLPASVSASHSLKQSLPDGNRQWYWTPRHRGFDTTVDVAFNMRLESPNSVVNNARLTVLSLVSKIQIANFGFINSSWLIEESDQMPSEVSRFEDDPSDFPYSLSFDSAATDSNTFSQKVKCSIEGLSVKSHLAKKDTPAVFSSLGAIAALATQKLQPHFSSLVAAGVTKTDSASGAPPNGLRWPISSFRLKSSIKLVETAADTEFLQTFPVIAPALPTTLFLWLLTTQDDEEDRVVSSRREFAEKYILRCAKIAGDSIPPRDLSNVGDIFASFESIVRAFPAGAPIVSLISATLGLFNSEELARVGGIAAIAAFEAKDNISEYSTQTGTPKRSDLGGTRASIDPPGFDELKTYFCTKVFHLGPLREEPKSLYGSDPPSSITDIGIRGERAIACLRYFGHVEVYVPVVDKDMSRAVSMSLIQAVTMWASYIGVFRKIDVEHQTKYGTVCEIMIDRSADAIRADLTNVGVGVSQVLPVIIACLAAPLGSTILIEQPELHLHPAMQSRLAKMICACIRTGRQIIVETHSEHLINGMRLAVASDLVSAKEDVSLVYLTRDPHGTEPTIIGVDESGGLDKWPVGFFDETERALTALMKKRMVGE